MGRDLRPETWPQWWRGVDGGRSKLAAATRTASGALGRYSWRSKLPYDLVFDDHHPGRKPPYLLEGEASGELAGTGRWRLFEQDGSKPVTAVLYEWNVHTTKPWMNAIAPLAAPVFAWNHDWVMRNGGTGLAEAPRLPSAGRRTDLSQPDLDSPSRPARSRLHSPRRFGTLICRVPGSECELSNRNDGGNERMNLKPLGDRLIVQAIEEEETTASGLVLPDTAKEKPQKGKVIAVGDGA